VNPAVRLRGDRGVLSTVIVLPCLLVAIWLVLQYALALHVRHGAQVAAQDAALAAANGSADPRSVALSLMDSLGDTATNIVVSVDTTSDQVTVTVSADVIEVVPLGDYHVTESASAPIERFIAEDERS